MNRMVEGRYKFTFQFDSSSRKEEKLYDIIDVKEKYILYQFGVLEPDTMYRDGDKIVTIVPDGLHCKYDLNGKIIEKNHIQGTFIYTCRKQGVFTDTGSFKIELESKF